MNHKEHSFAGVWKPTVGRESDSQKFQCLWLWCGMLGVVTVMIRQCPSGSLPFCSLCVHSGPGHYYQFFLDYCSWLLTFLPGVKRSSSLTCPPSGGEVAMLWFEQDAPLLRKLHWLCSAFCMVLKLCHGGVRLSSPALSPASAVHTLRFVQTKLGTYPQHLPPWKSLEISLMDPSILLWANVNLPLSIPLLHGIFL